MGNKTDENNDFVVDGSSFDSKDSDSDSDFDTSSESSFHSHLDEEDSVEGWYSANSASIVN